jgi:hypothetical protein
MHGPHRDSVQLQRCLFRGHLRPDVHFVSIIRRLFDELLTDRSPEFKQGNKFFELQNKLWPKPKRKFQ